MRYDQVLTVVALNPRRVVRSSARLDVRLYVSCRVFRRGPDLPVNRRRFDLGFRGRIARIRLTGGSWARRGRPCAADECRDLFCP